MKVERFRGDYEFLSNFYPAKLLYDGIAYYNAEAAYQAQKCADTAQRIQFSKLYSDESKRFGRSIAVREDWDEVKLGVMEQVVRAKFEQNPRLAQLLMSTGEMQLVEGNTWHDIYWGVDLKTGEGKNHLGHILMQLRESFRLNGITDQSSLRPLKEYHLNTRLILTDESLCDVDAECIVQETDSKAVADLALGDARLKTAPVWGVPYTILVHSPVYMKDDEMYLSACYRNSLDIAAAQGYKNIAFPAISVGKKCFPKQKSAKIAVAAVTEWLAHNTDTELKIWIVPEDPRILEFTLEVFRKEDRNVQL